jgi:membrane-bound serine protease (ClpP class)
VNARLTVAVISTLLEETALVVVVKLLLPRLGIILPLPDLILLMLAWLAFSVFIYRLGSRALLGKPVGGLSSMVGSKGVVTSPLVPEGMVRIKGELWKAKSAGDRIDAGEAVIVVGQDGLKLVVKNISAEELKEMK